MQADELSCTSLISVPADLQRGHDSIFANRLKHLLADRPGDIGLDCSKLDPVHSNHIALLWMAREQCEEASVKFHLENVSEGLVRSLQALDLIGLFGLESQDIVPDTRKISLDHVPQATDCSLTFVLTVEGVDDALEEFLRYLSDLQLPKESIFDLRTVFYEVATNIRSHSGLKSEARADFAAHSEGQIIRMEFRDCGIPFDPVAQDDSLDTRSAAQNRQTRGFGLSLIKRMVDECAYERRDEANVLTLTRRLGGSPQ